MRQINTILQRYAKAQERQQKWENLCKEAYEIAMPERNVYDKTTEGQDESQGIFDSTAMIASNSFVSTMLRLLFPPDTPFAKLSLGPTIPEQDKTELQEILDKVNEIHFNAVKASNFYVEIVPFLYDLFVGTACLLVQKGDVYKPFVHKAIPMNQLAFEESPEGEPNCVYRKWKLKEDEVLQMWPKGTYTQEGEKGGCPKEVEVLECVYYDNEERVWQYAVINFAKKEYIYQAPMKFNPFNVARWTNISGEINGRGPLLQALPEFRFLNRLKYFTSEGMPFRIFPILTVTDDDALDADKFVLQPGTLNKVERNGGPNGPSVQALNYGGDVNYEQYQVEEVRYNIKKLTLDDQMPAMNGPVKSATEWIQRAQEIRKDRTVAFSKIQTEVIRQVFIKQMHILYEMGALPQEFYQYFKIEDINQFVLKMDVESPVSRQEKLEDAQQAFSILQAMLATDPNATQTVFKTEEMFEDLGIALGIKAKYVRNATEREQLKAAQAEQLSAMQNEEAMREVEKEVMIDAAKR